MYTAFYGLREKPFVLSPDPRFLYLAGSHREALAHLLYGIEQGEGFISITGEVGTGKTTLCRTLLERLEGDLELAFLFNPSRTALELLQSICAEFGLPAEGLARRTLMQQLNHFLVEQKRIGRRVLLIIDEAQTLSESTLEQVRLLSNLETSRDKLIQILLLGQPELDRKLDERGLRQLRQRISVRWKLGPLGAQETRAYVRYRLSVAAGEPKDLFSDAALREVHRRTGGIPRLVNQLCDRALLAGYATRSAQVGPKLIRDAAKEIPDARLPREGGLDGTGGGLFARPWAFAAMILVLVGLSLFTGLQVGRTRFTNTFTASVFKPDALRADFEGADSRVGPPPVGANMSVGSALESAETPPLIELIRFVPKEILAGLKPIGERINSTAAIDRAKAGVRGAGPGVIAVGVSPVASSPNSQSNEASPAESKFSQAETALAPGLLRQLLKTRNPQAAFADSRDVLLERFGRRVTALSSAPTSPDGLRRDFEGRGLMTTFFDGGSIELLRRLDHPVALPLATNLWHDDAGLAPTAPVSERRWVAITGFRGDRARVAGLLPEQIVTISIDELRAHWLETGLIVWERFEPVPNILGRNDEGEGVLWLQRALAELRFYDGSPTSRFDAETTEALRRFQSTRGLIADGVAGPLTQIAIYGRLARYPVPRLSRADGRTASSSRRRAENATTETRRSSVASPPNSTSPPSVRPPAQGAARG